MLRPFLFGMLIVVSCTPALAQWALDEKPAGPDEWGFRPFEGERSAVNPAPLVWRPQKKGSTYEVELSRSANFDKIEVRATDLRYACYSHHTPLELGKWHWRFRATADGKVSAWSGTRSFAVAKDSVSFPMPRRDELIARIPKQHPRLFVRPEEMTRLRELAKGDSKKDYEALKKQCEAYLKNPPPTAEPPKYPPGMKTKSEEWREIWWGNRTYTIAVLNAAATLGFTRRLDGNEQYGVLGKRLLMEVAQWDPKGATNYHYNDEAGMPYVYFFARAYTFLNDLLSEEEKAKCREVIRVRGNEMYAHLNPRHLWKPYASHSNRAWHKLGEAGIAFLGEIPEAEEWTWFAMNVFWNVYPVWSDSDGGWHEGSGYWNSYVERFTYFADVMRVAMKVNAFQKPFFSHAGDYPMYLQPPGTPGGGFGDLVTTRDAKANVRLVSALAGQARNSYWQWYVEAQGGPVREGGYIGYVRGSMPKVDAKRPDDLPTSKAFWGTGQAYLNTTLLDAKQNVEIAFKSSPFGTQSHGYDSNNTFLVYAFGQRLLAPTGRRDIYGSDHHQNWMWETKSVNGIAVDGKGQIRHSGAAAGKLVAFHTSKEVDYVSGEAAESYAKGTLDRFTRHIIFVKPGLIVVYDDLAAPKAAAFDYYLHAPVPIDAKGQDLSIASGDVNCRVRMLAPQGMQISVTDQYDPPMRERAKAREWHMTARTQPAQAMKFVTVIRPYRQTDAAPAMEKLTSVDGGYVLEADTPEGKCAMRLTGGRVVVEWKGKQLLAAGEKVEVTR